MHRLLSKLMLMLGAIGLLLTFSAPAMADFAITLLVDGAPIVTIEDNDAPAAPNQFLGDLNLALGTIELSGILSVAGTPIFEINLESSVTNSPGGTLPNPAGGALQSGIVPGTAGFGLRNVSGASHTLGLLVSSQDYSVPGGETPMVLTNTGSGSTILNDPASGDITSFLDTLNTLFGLSNPTPPVVFAVSGAPGDQSWQGSTAVSPITYSPNPAYSLTHLYNITLGAGDAVTGIQVNTFTAPLAVIPAPGGLALALAGLPFLGLGWLRRRK
jgi:hypothetical protein